MNEPNISKLSEQITNLENDTKVLQKKFWEQVKPVLEEFLKVIGGELDLGIDSITVDSSLGKGTLAPTKFKWGFPIDAPTIILSINNSGHCEKEPFDHYTDHNTFEDVPPTEFINLLMTSLKDAMEERQSEITTLIAGLGVLTKLEA